MWLVKKCVSLLRLKQKFPWYDKKHIVDGCAEQNVLWYLKSRNNKLQFDEYWNLYLINPWTPLLCAHMDTVQKEDDAENVNTICLSNDWIIKWDNIIIWWDDKCWIAIAMEVYEKLGNKVSLLFPRQEETWCNGSREFCTKHWDLLKQCTYCLVLDRRWNADIISNDNWYCSLEFQNDLVKVANEWWFKYKPEHWLCSDANNIRAFINCVNLSVWYYNPHSKSEYVVADDLKNAYNLVMYLVDNLKWTRDIYKEPERKTVYTYPKSSYYNYKPAQYYGKSLRDYDDDDYYWARYYNYSTKAKPVSQWSVSLNKDKWKKNEDKRTEDQKYTASFFLIDKQWLLEVKQDIVFYDEDFDDFIEIPKWKYRVDSYEDAEWEEIVDTVCKTQKKSGWSKVKKLK